MPNSVTICTQIFWTRARSSAAPGIGLVEDLLLGRAAAEQDHDLVHQLLAGAQVAVLARRVADEAERGTAGNDAEDLRRIEAAEPAAEGVASLVVGDDPALLLGQAARLL